MKQNIQTKFSWTDNDSKSFDALELETVQKLKQQKLAESTKSKFVKSTLINVASIVINLSFDVYAATKIFECVQRKQLGLAAIQLVGMGALGLLTWRLSKATGSPQKSEKEARVLDVIEYYKTSGQGDIAFSDTPEQALASGMFKPAP